jgi:hypothetical protein
MAICLACEKTTVAVITHIDDFECVTIHVDCYNPFCYSRVKYICMGPTVVSRELFSMIFCPFYYMPYGKKYGKKE